MEMKLSKKVKRAFAEFLEQHPPKQFSRHLRQMLMEYLQSGIAVGLPEYYATLIWTLDDFFQLLDVADDQPIKPKKEGRKKNRESDEGK